MLRRICGERYDDRRRKALNEWLLREIVIEPLADHRPDESTTLKPLLERTGCDWFKTEMGGARERRLIPRIQAVDNDEFRDRYC